jgi:hypothetical protein
VRTQNTPEIKERSRPMNEDTRATRTSVNPASPVSPACEVGGTGDLQPVALALEMQSPAAMLTVLTTVARLGCRATRVDATERHAALGVLAPRRVAHRLLPCLGQVIGILAVMEAPAALPAPVDRPGAGA